MKIAIIEDSPLLRERLKTLLVDLPKVELVGEADNVKEAMKIIQNVKPDVVIVDIHLLGGSGIEVLRRAKEQQPAPLVIVLTNYTIPAYRTACANEGADYFLDKSTEFYVVADILRELT